MVLNPADSSHKFPDTPHFRIPYPLLSLDIFLSTPLYSHSRTQALASANSLRRLWSLGFFLFILSLGGWSAHLLLQLLHMAIQHLDQSIHPPREAAHLLKLKIYNDICSSIWVKFSVRTEADFCLKIVLWVTLTWPLHSPTQSWTQFLDLSPTLLS